MMMRKKSPPLRHSCNTLFLISSAFSPETQKSLLLIQASISFSRLRRTLRFPNRGSRRLMTFDSVRYTAKSPAERIMWYSNVVPDRPQPSTKTGALLLSAFSPTVSGALFSVSCMSGP